MFKKYSNIAEQIFSEAGYTAMHDYLRKLCRGRKLQAGDAFEIELKVTNMYQRKEGGKRNDQ